MNHLFLENRLQITISSTSNKPTWTIANA
uniref:Uncharacterized protein n=1 Tax=Anguilla anguilla TaxID=7936 RepID=A0A0E9U2Z4_ANGAN